jgi:phosphate transport system permease protein
MSGMFVLAIMVMVGLFLSIEASDALRSRGFSFLTTMEWQPDRGTFGIAAVLLGTVLIAAVAVLVAIPISMGTALYISEIAPPRFRSVFVSLVDLMAAVPSVVYGLWGLFFFQGAAISLSRWLSTWFGWIPIFAVEGSGSDTALSNATVFTASTFVAGVVVALMVMPIQCSVMREVFSQVPLGEREGAYALGATRWGMIRIVSLPFARGGIIGGTMLGLGRALGETIAVLLIISPRFDFNFRVLEAGGNSVSSLIALRYAEATRALIDAGGGG